jgi:hypothetical protein
MAFGRISEVVRKDPASWATVLIGIVNLLTVFAVFYQTGIMRDQFLVAESPSVNFVHDHRAGTITIENNSDYELLGVGVYVNWYGFDGGNPAEFSRSANSDAISETPILKKGYGLVVRDSLLVDAGSLSDPTGNGLGVMTVVCERKPDHKRIVLVEPVGLYKLPPKPGEKDPDKIVGLIREKTVRGAFFPRFNLEVYQKMEEAERYFYRASVPQ